MTTETKCPKDQTSESLAHICTSIWEWIYAKQINTLPLETQGRHMRGGGYWSNIKKSREAGKRLDRLAPTLVHVCGFIWERTQDKSKSPLNTQGAFGGVGGNQLKRLGKLSNGCTDRHQIWFTSADSSGNGIG